MYYIGLKKYKIQYLYLCLCLWLYLGVGTLLIDVLNDSGCIMTIVSHNNIIFTQNNVNLFTKSIDFDVISTLRQLLVLLLLTLLWLLLLLLL